MTVPEKDHPGVIAFPPVIFLTCLFLGFGLQWLVPLRLPCSTPVKIAGGVLALTAGIVAALASRAMHKAGTNVHPHKPTITIVATGPYRFTRNPMYLSLCLLHAGIALLLGGLTPLAMTVVLATVLHFGVILREEKYLAAKFGPAYLNYQKSVRRWL